MKRLKVWDSRDPAEFGSEARQFTRWDRRDTAMPVGKYGLVLPQVKMRQIYDQEIQPICVENRIRPTTHGKGVDGYVLNFRCAEHMALFRMLYSGRTIARE